MVLVRQFRIRTFAIFLWGMVLGCIFGYYIVLRRTDSVSQQQETIASDPQSGLPSGSELDPDDYYVVVDADAETVIEDDRVATDLTRRIRILCWVTTQPKSAEAKALHVRETWGRRCTSILFMSTTGTNASFPVIELRIREQYILLWAKTKASLSYIYHHYLNDFDWFLKADDDTYFFMENVRYLLKDYDPEEPLYLGRRLFWDSALPYTYMSGGAGYVLSREALRRVVTQGIEGAMFCRASDEGMEDYLTGLCLEMCGVKPVDTRDSFGRQRFHTHTPWFMLDRNLPASEWLWTFDYYPTIPGPDCCSDFSISFHYFSPEYMYFMEFFAYHLKVYGIETYYRSDSDLQSI